MQPLKIPFIEEVKLICWPKIAKKLSMVIICKIHVDIFQDGRAAEVHDRTVFRESQVSYW